MARLGLSRRHIAAIGLAAAMPLAAVGGLKLAVANSPMALPALSHSAVVVDAEGRLLRPFPIADGRWRLETRTADVDSGYIDMLLAFEDRRFRSHHGVDPVALARSVLTGLRALKPVSGGSTLTMQVARLVEGSPTRNLPAKLRQIIGALALEQRHGKAAILDHYLNRAPLGGNIEGVRAASLAFFGKEPKRLSAAESALLVALPQSPETRRLDGTDDQRTAAYNARNRVLARARDMGVIDQRQYERAVAADLPRRRPMPALAPHLSERLAAAMPDRLRHATTLDAALQARLQTLALRSANRLGRSVSVAILVADHRTGAIRASVGAADYFDRARKGYVDMTRAVRSPGSTLKPLIYGLAFADGKAHPESLIEDRPMAFDGYRPSNFDRDYRGTVTVREALQLSLNVPAVQLLRDVGPARLLAKLEEAGAHPVLPPNATANLAVGLGGVGMTLTDLVRLQSVFASGGEAIALYEDPADGSPEPGDRVLDPRAAWQVASILAGVQDPGGMTPRGVAFKTGTSYGYRDAWAVGFDGAHTVGVWVGRPDGQAVSGFVGGLVGIEIAAPIMDTVFTHLGKPVRLPEAPDGTVVAATADLPPALRRVGALAERGGETAPQIAYPPDRSEIEVADGAALAVEVERGRLPLTMLVNGEPIEVSPWSRSVHWNPAGEGQVDLVVIDAEGQAARSSVFLRRGS